MLNWWEHKAWRDYASRRFNYFARKRGYRIIFDPEVATAAVQPKAKNVYLNPLWRPNKFIRPGLKPKDKRLTILNGFVAHEAAHVRFSPAEIPAHLHDLWNSLEDERIERLQATDYRSSDDNLLSTFSYIGDGIIQNLEPVSPLDGTLFWRFWHDRRDLTFKSTDEHTWADVKPLVEAAWKGTADQVVWIAEQLWLLLGQPEFQQPNLKAVFARGEAVAEQDRAKGDEHMPLDHPDLLELELRAEVEGTARSLSKVLRVKQRTLPVANRTKGKLSVSRIIAKSEKPFLRKPDETPPPPLFTLIWDTSLSMEMCGTHPHAQKAVMLLNRTCEIANVKRQIITFGETSTHLAKVDQPFATTYKDITLQRSLQGDTVLSPALELAFRQPGKQVIIILSDGGISERDEAICKLAVRGKDHFIAPILVAGTDDSAYQRIFKRSYTVEDVTKLPTTLKTFLTNIQRL